MKVLVADGRASAGAGAISLPGAAVGDRVAGVVCATPGRELQTMPTGAFEPVITVADQVQQLLSGLGQRDRVTDTPQQSSWGHWRFAFILKEGAALSADGAISLKEGTAAITKGTAATLTIADPTAGDDDGKELTVISTTAAAHTLSNAAGSGFNAAGASADVATFGGAIGDSITLFAYGGKWLVKSKTNVTLG
jgi:hypothetical protein